LHRFSREFIIKIDDITEFVKEQAHNIPTCDSLLTPVERVYTCLTKHTADTIGVDPVQPLHQ
jgi:hypothetical protein